MSGVMRSVGFNLLGRDDPWKGLEDYSIISSIDGFI